MTYNVRLGLALSSAAVAFAIAGCASPRGRTAVASSFGGKADGEVGLALRALAAMNANDIPAAIGFAERAVARTPDDAGFRALLGNAYFAGGRFASAESAYKDSLAIYANQPQIVLKLALVEIGQGKTGEAIGLLSAARDVLDAADYGLALALAGRPAEAAAALRHAARAPGADSRVRQNLALAYALSGDWTNARTIAAQDLAANQVDARIEQWMKLAAPGRASDQVAALTGVTRAASDPGQPVRLALRKGEALVAQAAPPPQPAAVAVPSPQPQYVAPAPEPEFAQAVPPAPPPADPVRVAAFAPEPQPAVAEVAPAQFEPVRIVAAAVAEIATVAFEKLVPPPAFVAAQAEVAPLATVPAQFEPVRLAAAAVAEMATVAFDKFVPRAAFAAAPDEVAPPAPVPAQFEPVRMTAAAVAEMATVAFDKFVPRAAFVAAAQAERAPPAAKPALARKASAPRKPAVFQRAAAANFRPAILRRGGSTAVVQLGAYRSPQRVLVAWNAAARRHSSLRVYAPMSARFVSVRGPVYRLSVRGFANQSEASTLCASLRRSGGSCFVRTVAGDAPVYIASR